MPIPIEAAAPISGFSLTGVDYGVGVVLVLSAFLSAARGFVREGLSLGVWLGAYGISSRYAPWAFPWTETWLAAVVADPAWQHAVVYGVVFVSSAGIGLLIADWMSQWLRRSPLHGMDRLLGFVYGGLRGVALWSLVVWGISHFPSITHTPSWQQSYSVRQVAPLVAWIDRHIALPRSESQTTANPSYFWKQPVPAESPGSTAA